jgi:hypothetical protein
MRVQRIECLSQIGVAIAKVTAEGDRDCGNGLLLPARRQHRADALGTDRSTPDDVFEA